MLGESPVDSSSAVSENVTVPVTVQRLILFGRREHAS
jgi:hypothetical protein